MYEGKHLRTHIFFDPELNKNEINIRQKIYFIQDGEKHLAM